jgi:general secretion pathway protein L
LRIKRPPYNDSIMLILALPLHPGAASSAVSFALSADGHSISHSGQATPPDLPRASGEVVAVVPWQRLSWHAVTLPPQTGTRLTTVLHGLLEEQLLDDPTQLHLAVAPHTSSRRGGPTLVAACSRAWLQQTLAPLEAAGLRVQRLVPEYAPAGSASVLQLVQHAGQVIGLLRHSQGVIPIPHSTRSAWAASLAEVSTCWAEPGVAQRSSDWCSVEAGLQPAAQRWLQATHTDWNLAQGEWGQSHVRRSGRWLQQAWQTVRHDRDWRAVRWGLGLLLGAQLLGLNAWAWREQALLQEQQQRQQRLLTDTFPSVRVVIDPALQMRREVDALRQATGSPSPQDADVMLAHMAQAWPAQTAIRGLSYSGGELRWQTSGSIELDAAASQRLQTQGYRLSQQGDEYRLRWEGSR